MLHQPLHTVFAVRLVMSCSLLHVAVAASTIACNRCELLRNFCNSWQTIAPTIAPTIARCRSTPPIIQPTRSITCFTRKGVVRVSIQRLYLQIFANKVLRDFHDIVSACASSCLFLRLRCNSVVLIVIFLRFTLAQCTPQFSDVLGSEGVNNFKN